MAAPLMTLTFANRRGLAVICVLLISGASHAVPTSSGANEVGSDAVAKRWCLERADPGGRDLPVATGCREWLLHVLSLDSETMDIGYLWVLRKLLDRHSEPFLEAFVASWAPHYRNGTGAIVYPNADRRLLPKDPGEGLERFYNWLSAPSGRPDTRAVDFIDAYTSLPASGYVLTHQLLVLQWAEDTNLTLPVEVRNRRPALLERIRAEHSADPNAGDLDFERTMILLLYGDVSADEARRWIDRVLGAWDSATRKWRFKGEETIQFDGKRYRLRHGPHHPTAMALGCAKIYLDRFSGTAKVGEAQR